MIYTYIIKLTKLEFKPLLAKKGIPVCNTASRLLRYCVSPENSPRVMDINDVESTMPFFLVISQPELNDSPIRPFDVQSRGC